MAIYHVEAQVIGRSQGRSSVASAAYRAAEKLHDERTGLTHDYTKKIHDIAHKEIMLPAGAHAWMQKREKLWNVVEIGEKRKDAQLAREFNIALPKELTTKQNIELAREFVQKEFVAKGMVADLCIHKGHSKGGEEQPHIHVMLTMREVTEEGFGQKVREWNSRERLEQQREAWAEYANRHLALNGHDIRIDHRSYEEQGIDLEPQYKIGPTAAKERMARYEDHQRIAKENGERIFEDPKVALNALTRQQSTFTHQDLARVVNRQTIDSEQFQRVYEKVKYSKEVIYLGNDEQGRERFTTQEMLTLEKEMLERAGELKEKAQHAVGQVKAPEHFSEQQKDALEHMLKGDDLSCVIGYAGTGKSTILNAARQAWEEAGYKVHGITLSGIAAENLAGASGIGSRTAASRFYYWDRDRELLTSKDVIVVDEAGMLGSRQMARIVEEVNRGGAKLVLIGDPQQLQAIEAGAAFRAIAEKANYVELTEVRRQHEEWQQEATKEFAQCKVAEGLDRYDAHDNIHEYETQSYAKQGLVEMWNDARINNPQESQIMLAYTRNDVKDLNEAARDLRKQNHELGEEHTIQTERGERQFAEGDRIYFLQNERSLGVMNGTLGTIEKIDDAQITIRLDKDLERNDQTITINTAFYNQIEHGYAATIHKAQGVTVDRSYVLASKYMDSHSSYVSLSRHRESADLFYGKDEFANKRALAHNLGRDRSKDVSLDYGIEKERGGRTEEIALTSESKEHEADHKKNKSLSIEEIRERYAPKTHDVERTHEKDHKLSVDELNEHYAAKANDIERAHEETQRLRIEEMQERYASAKEKNSLQTFRERYEQEHPEVADSIKSNYLSKHETQALALEKEFKLLEKALETSNSPRSYQRQLEKCAHKIANNEHAMDYLSERNPELTEKVHNLNEKVQQRAELAREMKIERDLGHEMSL